VNWKRPFLVIFVWVGVYYLPMWPDIENPAFYNMQVLSSVFLATSLFYIDKFFPGSLISSLSILGIMLSTTAFAMMNKGILGDIRDDYDSYDTFQNTLNTIELCLLAIGLFTIGVKDGHNERDSHGRISDLFYSLVSAFTPNKTVQYSSKKVHSVEESGKTHT